MAMLAFGAMSQITDVERQKIEEFTGPKSDVINRYETSAKKLRSGEIRNYAADNYAKMTTVNPTSPDVNMSKAGEALTPSSKIEEAFNWGTGYFVEDGKPMTFRQSNEWHYNFASTPFFKSVTIDLLDDAKAVTKSFNLKVSDTSISIRVMGQFSKTFFNTDSKYEFMIAVTSHIDNSGNGPIGCRDTLYVVNEDGKILKKFGTSTGAKIVYDGSVRKLLLYKPFYSGIQTSIDVEVYNPKTFVLEHKFSTPSDLLSYSSGPVLQYVKIDNVPYFYTGHYEKPFIANGDHANPIVEKNNKYLIKLYSVAKYEVVKEIGLKLIGQDKNEWSMVAHGYFSIGMKYDLSTRVFNDDDKFEILYAMSRFDISCDCERADFYLVDEDGNIIKDVTKRVGISAMKMADIQGENDQYVLFIGADDKVEGLRFMDMPSCEVVSTFMAEHNGEMMSFSFQRVPAKEGYDYVFGLGRGELIGNNLYGGVAYYNTKGEMVRRDRVDLGPRGAFFELISTPAMLSPYWFDTDDDNEYAYFGKTFASDGVGSTSFFGIAESDMSTPYKWDKNEYGSMAGAGITVDATDALDELYVSFMPQPPYIGNYNIGTTLFYSLPFKSFTSGGTGTEEDPYIVTNPGELNAMRDHLESHFALGNDIDLADYSHLDGKGWLGIGTSQSMFKGSLDGRNHSIKNLFMDRTGKMDVGLFGYCDGAVVRNLNMTDVNIINGQSIGTIAAEVRSTLVENCHVMGKLIGEKAGGVVGSATLNSKIKMCSFDGVIETTSGAGGIAYKATTGAKILLCNSNGSVSGKASVGGIIGNSLSDGTVENCYSNSDVNGNNILGGIAGDCSGFINKTYSRGAIKAEGEKFVWRTGGIVGTLTQKMAPTDVKNSVALNTMVTANESYGRVIGDKTVNDFVTSSNNYAIPTMKIGAAGSEAAVTSADATSTNGADKAFADMNQAFYESIDWKFGADSLNPWKMVDGYPRLWYEFVVRGVSLNEIEKTIDLGATFQLVGTVLPLTAENKALFWESSDNKIVKVNSEGVVTAMGKGVATITVSTDEGDYKSVCVFNVNVPVKGVTLNKTTMELAKDKTETLIATVNPDNANNQKVLWTSSDPTVALVSHVGLVKGVKAGKTIITVMTEDGLFKATCEVTVTIPVDRVILNETSLDMFIDETFTLKATVRPAEATNKSVTWSSSDGNIASVDAKGVVKAVAAGKAVITVTTVDGGFKATCDVNVKLVSVDELSAEHINVYHANGQIVINSSVDIRSIIVYDISGRAIYNGESLSISTSSWNGGIYVVRVTDVNSVVKTSKIAIK